VQTDDPKTGIIGLFIQGAISVTIGAKRLRFVPIINAYDPTSSLQPRPRRLILTPSPEAAGKSLRTFVDAALPLDERGQGFGNRLVLSCVSQHSRPF
jgi:hypothetical protein